MPSRITSRQHPLVQRFRRLARRREDGVILVDGEHLVTDALAAGLPFEAVLTDERHVALARRAEVPGQTPVFEASASVLEAASPVASPTGLVAIVAWRPCDIADALDDKRITIGLVGVQDPGNVGSVIRSADALGAGGVLLLDGSADPGSWKALRGAMGSTFRIPVARGRLQDALAVAARRRIPTIGAASTGGTRVAEADLTPPALILLGSEGAGLSDEVMSQVDRTVSIPMGEGVESLNVAVSAALLLWEAGRQDRGTHP